LWSFAIGAVCLLPAAPAHGLYFAGAAVVGAATVSVVALIEPSLRRSSR
jgi:DME family drug/metabolite transporter